MKKGLFALALIALAFGTISFTNANSNRDTFAPENDLWIGADDKAASGITQEDFIRVIDELYAIYAPIVEKKGGKLNINKGWDDGTVNAYASRSGKTWKVAMFGGLARYEGMTPDGFSLVICHELAHHLGGAPKSSSWASNEGQSDYIGTMKCMREVFKNQDNLSVVRDMTIEPLVKTKCEAIYRNAEQAATCMRIASAGKVLGVILQKLGKEKDISFDTPSTAVVTSMDNAHPKAQCRLDTYLAGALCDKDLSQPVSDTDVLAGTCNTSAGDTVGVRPLCWFKP